MECIYIEYQGETKTLYIKNKFEDYKISKLRMCVRLLTGVEDDKQHLLYESKVLENSHDRRVMSFQDYGIYSGAHVVLELRLNNGISPIPVKNTKMYLYMFVLFLIFFIYYFYSN
ncbi:hypothetical protein LOD99_10505 [Oopsacas minuta]|uniref:Ubiquitin-like domain-containing protein n=1 Tax=Oopsacas minuta TaxID=111878 RepID=A0AAV7KGC1_9METZ|nr:hypothetical protein LOD99_10505 [Oopsacas minuta]